VRLRVDEGTPERLHAILSALIKEGYPVSGFLREEVRLEDAFVDILTRGIGKGAGV